jgi:sortase A
VPTLCAVASALDKRRRSSGAPRAVLRFVAAVMATSGLLLLADAGLTLAWQEPISAVIALRQQSQLEDQLQTHRAPENQGQSLSKSELDRLAERHDRETGVGEAWGRIELPELDREYVVVEGTDEASLRKGPGHYPDTQLPGQDGTTAIAGHRTTYLAPFRTIDQLEEGDEIVVEMPWARFTYAVEDQDIVEPTQTEVTDKVGHERLVLSACHPLYSAAQRIVVFAELEDVKPA